MSAKANAAARWSIGRSIRLDKSGPWADHARGQIRKLLSREKLYHCPSQPSFQPQPRRSVSLLELVSRSRLDRRLPSRTGSLSAARSPHEHDRSHRPPIPFLAQDAGEGNRALSRKLFGWKARPIATGTSPITRSSTPTSTWRLPRPILLHGICIGWGTTPSAKCQGVPADPA
jgi:hypothetical protein